MLAADVRGGPRTWLVRSMGAAIEIHGMSKRFSSELVAVSRSLEDAFLDLTAEAA